MKIAGIEVLLPSEDPIFYDLDWRNKIAKAVSEGTGKGQLPKTLRKDPYIKTAIKYFNKKANLCDRARRLCLVKKLYDNFQTRCLMESLLLSGADYEAIAKDLDIQDSEDIRFYGHLFFDVRMESGALRMPNLLRIRFADETPEGAEIPQHLLWKRAALSGGLEMLHTLLQGRQSSKGSHESALESLAEHELTRKILRGGISVGELARLQSVLTEKKRLRLETEPERNEAMECLKKLFAIMAPKMVPLTQDATQIQAQRDALQRKLGTERRIHETPIEDRGIVAASNSISKQLQQHLQAEATGIAAPRPQPVIKGTGPTYRA